MWDVIFTGVIFLGGVGAIYMVARQIRINIEKKSEKRFKEFRSKLKNHRETYRRNILNKNNPTPIYLKTDKNLPLYFVDGCIPAQPIRYKQLNILSQDDPGCQSQLFMDILPRSNLSKLESYSKALEKFDCPSKFEDRDQYRLLEIRPNELVFSKKKYSYFDKINNGEFLVYELVADKLLWNRHTLLNTIKQPKDHISLAGISTLTLLHDGSDLRFIMHQRGKKETAYAMGTLHVIPAGEFQPSSRAPGSFKDDFNLWKNILREYAEELGGVEEYDGNSSIPFNYDQEPIKTMEAERLAGNIKRFYLGTGLDTVSFQSEILTAVVFKEEAFNRIFPKIITKNDEGDIVTDSDRWGRPFNRQQYDNCFLKDNILCTGEAILNIAWSRKDTFLNCFNDSI